MSKYIFLKSMKWCNT